MAPDGLWTLPALPIFVFGLSLASCTRADNASPVRLFATKDVVIQRLGQPANRFANDKREAWKYCKKGVFNGTVTTVWFENQRVVSAYVYSDANASIGDCSRQTQTIDWTIAPKLKGDPDY